MSDRSFKLYLLILLPILLLVYWPSLNGPFILDDFHTIELNGAIQNPHNWLKIWTSASYYSSLPTIWVYRPVTALSNLLMWQVGDGALWPFHVFKIIIFFLICLLLFNLWRTLLPKVKQSSILMALFIFAVNPVHSQVVGYISATSTLLAGFFILLSLNLFLKYERTNTFCWLAASWLSVLFAILSKEEGIVAIALIPLTHMYLNHLNGLRPLNKWSIKILASYLIPAFAGLYLLAYMYVPHTESSRGMVTEFEYFMTQWRAYIRYIIMLVAAYDLNADNLQFGFSFKITEPRVLAALIANLAIIGSGIFMLKKKPAITFAIFWFYFAISPASSVVPLAEPVNDHRAFIAYFGLFIIIILLLDRVRQIHKNLFYFFTLLFFVSYSLTTYQRSIAWGNNEIIWRDTVQKNPNSARAHNNLAVELMRKADYNGALPLLQKCAELAPNYMNCYLNLAVVYTSIGRDAEAERNYAQASLLDPAVVQSHMKWAQYLISRGKLSEAHKLLIYADQFVAGKNFEVRLHLIETEIKLGLKDNARRLLDEALINFGQRSELTKLKNTF